MRTFSRFCVACLVCLLVVRTARAAVISLDFNVQNSNSPFQISPTASGDEVAGTGTIFTGQTGLWNTLLVGTAPFELPDATTASITSPLTTGNLLDGAGGETLTTFTYGIGATPSSPINYFVFQGNGSGSTALRQDMLLQGASRPGPVAWEIAGLIPGNAYDLVLFGQRYNNTAFNGGAFTVFGNAPDLFDSQNDANFSNIIANAQGKITGTLAYASGSYGAWSGLQISGVFAGPELPPVPEPSSALLLSSGLLCLTLRRRRAD